ncbi:MAG: type II toxin-antitoxin system RelB/DinJ family antitoxin [Clostridia bacterium]|nr:type II toxin-antitoxin system RelB/DinJ family antitoxin [Clostridia bacterium]
MAQTNVNIRMDEATKVAFDKFCNEIGLSVSSAFNIFAKTVVREQRIPFELTTEVPNAITLAAMDSAEKESDVYGPFDSVDTLMEALNA